MKSKVLVWDNDGTVVGARNPMDSTDKAKIILPGVLNVMNLASYNFIISGFKSPESEMQNFDPEMVIQKFTHLMKILPINAAAFSPMIGGVACYVLIKRVDGSLIVKKAHEDIRYQKYIGKFKKPDIGMFTVMKDIAWQEFGVVIDQETSVMIGDTWHDEAAAKAFGINFIEAQKVHDHTYKLNDV